MNQGLSTGIHLSRRRFLVTAAAFAGAAVSCGGENGGDFPQSTPGPQAADTTTTPEPRDPIPVATELRVAYINLLSPIATDSNNTLPGETFAQRLDALIEELKVFKPDIVGFSEVFWKAKLGSARTILVDGLKMEPQYARANPWILGQSKEESDQTSKLYGFEEGELLLVRHPLTFIEAKRWPLNPRNSESEGRACLHAVVQAPDPLGRIDVYLTHLTSDNEKIRQAQAADVVTVIQKTRSLGPTIILGDFNDTPDSATIRPVTAAGFKDIAVVAAGDPGFPTCCRETVLGEQPPLTARTDFILTDRLGWHPTVSLFAHEPKKRADGTYLYASDHNGLKAVFPLKMVDR